MSSHLTHRCNAVRGHRTGRPQQLWSGRLPQEEKKKKIIHTTTETNRIPQLKVKRLDQRTTVDTYHSSLTVENAYASVRCARLHNYRLNMYPYLSVAHTSVLVGCTCLCTNSGAHASTTTDWTRTLIVNRTSLRMCELKILRSYALHTPPCVSVLMPTSHRFHTPHML